MPSPVNRRAFLILQVPYMLMAHAALTLLTWFPGAIFGPLQLGIGIQFPPEIGFISDVMMISNFYTSPVIFFAVSRNYRVRNV